MRPARSLRSTASSASALVALAACSVVLGGCWPRVGDANAIRPPGADSVSVSPSVPSGSVLFTVTVLQQFDGEQVDIRVDGQRIYRNNVTTPPGKTVTATARFAATPALRKLFVRVGTIDYNVSDELPVRIGEKTCATVTFVRNAAIPQQSRLNIVTPDTCP